MRGIYQLSGEPGQAPLVVPLAGGLAAVVLALVYAQLSALSGSLVVTLGALCAFSFALFVVVRVAGKLAHARSPRLLTGLGAGVGLFAVYAAWAAFLSAGDPDGPSYLSALYSPLSLADDVKQLLGRGPFGLSRPSSGDGFLATCWALEALVICAGPLLGGLFALEDEVFCEACGEWTSEVESSPRFELSRDEATLAALGAGSLDALEALPSVGEAFGAHFEVQAFQCTECYETATYQIQIVRRNRAEGEVKRSAVSPQILCGSDVLARLRRLAERARG